MSLNKKVIEVAETQTISLIQRSYFEVPIEVIWLFKRFTMTGRKITFYLVLGILRKGLIPFKKFRSRTNTFGLTVAQKSC